MSEPENFETFSFSSNPDYHPSQQEIRKFKLNGEVSEKFKAKYREFKSLMDIEIKEFQTKYNSVSIRKHEQVIKFYNSTDDYCELTPFFNVPISFAGITFISSDQIVCFAKAIYSDDVVSAFKILIQTKSYYAHNYAKNIDECLNWDMIYYPIVYTATNYKFKNESMKEVLMKSSGRYLIYDSPRDSKLGIGRDGKGQNTLGIMLMMIRDSLCGN